MLAPIKRLGSALFTVLFGLALAVNFTLADYLRVLASPALAPAQLGYATRGLWQTVTRGGKVYEVYAIRDSAQNIVGVAAYEAGTNGTVRVMNPQLEEELVFEAATKDQSLSSLTIPNASQSSTYPLIWGKWVPTSYGEALYVPNFFDYAQPSSFVNDSVIGPGVFLGQGLQDFNHRKELYADLFTATLFQSINLAGLDAMRKDEFEYTLRATTDRISGAPDALDGGIVLSDGVNFIFYLALHVEKLKHLGAFFERMDQMLGNTTLLLSFINLFKSTAELGSVSVEKWDERNIKAALEYHLALPGIDQRLADLERFFCGGACPSISPDAMIQGLVLAKQRYENLKQNLQISNPFIDLLKDPNVQQSGINWVSAAVGVLIAVLAIKHIIAAPVALVADFVIIGIKFGYDAYTDQKAGLENIRRLVLAYTLQKRLTDGLPSLNTDRRYALSILNSAYFNLHFYFSQLQQRAMDEANWFFEQSPSVCYRGHYAPTCIRPQVIDQATRARDSWISGHYLDTRYGFYLNSQQRTEWRTKIIPWDAPNPDQISVALSQITTTQVSRGQTVPLKATATSPVGIKQVNFYVYSGTERGTPYCTDDNGPDASGFWTCANPSRPGWDTLAYVPANYKIEAEAVNTFDARRSAPPAAVTVLPVVDTVQITANLSTLSPLLSQSFTVSGQVKVNNLAPKTTVPVQIDIIGTDGRCTANAAANTGNYTVTCNAPARAGLYTLRITAFTANGAGIISRDITATTDPTAQSRLAIEGFEVTDHVEPGQQVRFRAFVRNTGTTPMTFRLRYELLTTAGAVLATSLPSATTTLNPGALYPATGGADVRYLQPATPLANGNYIARATLLNSSGQPFNDTQPYVFSLGVRVADTVDFEQYIYDQGLWADTRGQVGRATFNGNNFEVRVLAVNATATRAQLEIRRNNTTIATGWYDAGREYYMQGNSVFLYIFAISLYSDGGKAYFALGEATSFNFNVRPANPLLAKAGLESVAVFESSSPMYNVKVDFGPDAQYVKDQWDPDRTKRNSAGTLYDLEFEVPLPPNVTIGRTYDFFVSMQLSTSMTSIGYLQKLLVQVIPPDDVGVSALTPAAGSTLLIGDNVPIAATIQNYASYTEAKVPVTLTITGPNGYTHTAAVDVSNLAGNASLPANFTWVTAGLQPGSYTLQVATSLQHDPLTGNNVQSRTITLTPKPALTVIASADQASYGQNAPILLSVVVNDPGSAPVPNCIVTAVVTGPSVNQTHTLAYNASTGRYEIKLTYAGLGSYQFTASASGPGYQPGQTPAAGSFSIVNAPPETVLVNTSVQEAAQTNSPIHAFTWSGTDSVTAIGALKYSYRVDGGAWSAYASTTTVTLPALADGLHVFEVRAYDGNVADSTPAQRTFIVDTISPSFDALPTANVSQITNGGTLVITADLSEAATLTSSLAQLDSGFTESNLSVEELDTTNHVYRLSYTISSGNTRPDGWYALPLMIQDAAGNVGSAYDLRVRLENNPPGVMAYTPAEMPDVAVDSVIKVVFSEEMNTGATEGAWSIVPAVSGSFTWEDTQTLVFTPSSDLEPDTLYTVTIGASAQDVAGKSLAAPVSWPFQTWHTDPYIAHTPVEGGTVNTAITVLADLATQRPSVTASLYYRIAGAGSFTKLAMTLKTGATYQALIPAASVTLAGVEYYLEATAGGRFTRHPTSGSHLIPIAPPPDRPALLTPANNAVTGDSTPDFTWTAPVTAATYQIQWDESSTFASPEQGDAGTPAYTPAQALTDGKYYWRVRAINAYGGVGVWSSASVFTVDTIPPNAPALLTPADNAILTTSKPGFTWSPVAGANGYDIQIDNDADFTTPIISPTATTSASFTAPSALAQGRYYWQVRARDQAGNIGEWSAARTLTINIQTAPADGQAVITATTATPSLTWAAVPGASGYQIEIATADDFDPATVVYTSPALGGTVTSHTLPATSALPHNIYFWRVNVTGYPPVSPVFRKFIVSPAPPAAPRLTDPIPGLVTSDAAPRFAWEASTSTAASPYTYELQVDNTTTFASPELAPAPIADLTFIPSSSLADGVYSWRMRTINRYGVPGTTWSTVGKFTIDTQPPLPPVLNTPAAGAIITASRPSFTWVTSLGASQYQIQVDDDPSFTSPEIPPTNVTTTTFTAQSVLSQGQYYWQVRALDAANNIGAWSSTRMFTFSILNAPADQSPTTDTTPAFSWVAVPGATHYQLELATDEAFTNLAHSSPVLSGLNYTLPLPITNGDGGYGVFYWRVKVNLGSGFSPSAPPHRVLFVTPSMPAPPTLATTYPPAVINIGAPEFRWTETTTPAGGPFTYDLQVASNNTFTNLVYQQTGLTGSVHTPSSTVLSVDGTYYWRMRTTNRYRVPSSWSSTRSFILDRVPPPAPQLRTPANGAVTTTNPLAFTWTTSAGATRYEIQQDTHNPPVAPTVFVTTASYTPPAPLLTTLYLWRVRAWDAAGNVSDWSPVWTVTFQSAGTAIPVTNRFEVAQPLLTWSRMSWATEYELQIDNAPNFTTPDYTLSGIPSGPAPAQVTPPLADGIWYWRVRARRSDGTWGSWSAGENFIVDTP